MNLLDLLVRELSTLRKERSIQEREELSRALEHVFSLMSELVEVDRISSDRALWIQAQLRAIYQGGPTLTAARIEGGRDPPADQLANAIASARMYFWLRTFHEQRMLDGAKRKNLVELGLVQPDWSLSYSAALQSVSHHLEDDDVPVSSAHIGAAKACALQTMADARTALLDLLP